MMRIPSDNKKRIFQAQFKDGNVLRLELIGRDANASEEVLFKIMINSAVRTLEICAGIDALKKEEQ